MASQSIFFERDKHQWPLSHALVSLDGDPSDHYFDLGHYRDATGKSAEVVYCRNLAEAEAAARLFVDEPVLGFDMEWPMDENERAALREKVGLIQLACERTIALFHISLHDGCTVDELIAPTLRKIVESPKCLKAGVGIMHADFQRLRSRFGLDPKGALELSHLGNLVRFGVNDPSQANTRLRSLASLVEGHLGQPLFKGGDVRRSDWTLPLNTKQQQYAANDAYASFLLVHCMNHKRLAMSPIPPFPRAADTYLPFELDGSVQSIQLESLLDDGRVTITVPSIFYSRWKMASTKGKRERDDDDDDDDKDDDGDDVSRNHDSKRRRIYRIDSFKREVLYAFDFPRQRSREPATSTKLRVLDDKENLAPVSPILKERETRR